MRYDRYTLDERASDQTPTVHVWAPDQAPRGGLVIAHGMGEHALRYERLASAACAAGFVVHAPDHRGHGVTASESDRLGDFGREGWRGVVDDLGAIVDRVRSSIGTGGLVLLGHSMGSMAVQHFLTESSDRIDAAALSGTTAVDQRAAAVENPDPDADLFATMNAAFAPNRTAFDWLSRDPEEVDRYVEDPLCGFMVEGASVASMGEAGQVFSRADAIARVRPDLPIYLFEATDAPSTMKPHSGSST